MKTITFQCTRLVDMGKKGQLRADQHGYYEHPIGGLEVYNSTGQYYVYDAIKELFQDSSLFMRRVKKGVLMGENGHPKKEPGMTNAEFVNRVRWIEETNIIAHFAKVWLDFENFKDEQGRKIIGIMAKVAPSGPHAASLERSFNNPNENTYFSIRSFADEMYDRKTSKIVKFLREIVTFDKVTEGGIEQASKYASPTLESDDVTILTENDFLRAKKAQPTSVGMESGAILTIDTLFDSFGWQKPTELPKILQWK